jgi:hypothetical protein
LEGELEIGMGENWCRLAVAAVVEVAVAVAVAEAVAVAVAELVVTRLPSGAKRPF